MIQRAQSIWMFLAAIAAFLTLNMPFYTGTPIPPITTTHVYAADNIFLMILTCALGSILLLNIFLYKQRTTQFRIGVFAVFIECINIFLYIRQTNKYTDGTFTIYSAIHVFIFIFIFLAIRGIYNDSKLIKDSNRLR